MAIDCEMHKDYDCFSVGYVIKLQDSAIYGSFYIDSKEVSEDTFIETIGFLGDTKCSGVQVIVNYGLYGKYLYRDLYRYSQL